MSSRAGWLFVTVAAATLPFAYNDTATSDQIRCYSCESTARQPSCTEKKTCLGTYCYKVDGENSLTGTRTVKKGCLTRRRPGLDMDSCKQESVRLPGAEPTTETWCVCQSPLCNSATPRNTLCVFLLSLAATVAAFRQL